ncbi:hypothetical protein CR513_55385, partial [Mucuna pruriens]
MEGKTYYYVQKLRPIPTKTPDVQSLQCWRKPKWVGRHPKGKLGGEAPTAPKGGTLAGIHRSVWAPSLWHSPLPQIEDYVDLVAIDAFLGKLLANTYYTLDYCYRKNGMGLRCCTSLLYLWMTEHLFHGKKKTTCSIEDHHWGCIRLLTKAEWTIRLDEVMEKTIRWYPQWNERKDVIIKCGGFPNISLMGT